MEQHMKKLVASILALAAMATAAEAHVGPAGHVHGFMDGFLHPFTGLDHMLAMVAVGAFAVILGGRALWALPATFMTVMLAGGLVGMTGFALPAVETGIAASVIVLGTVVALQWKAPLRVATALVGLFGIFHGFAHGAEMPAEAAAAGFASGFLIATGILHAIGMSLGLAVAKLSHPLMVRVMKIGGTICAATGIGLLAGWF